MNAKLMHGWEVEWCSELPIDEFGDTDMDRAVMCFRDFQTLEAARKFAKRILPKDQFGVVTINEFQMIPFEPGYPPTDRDYIGRAEHIES